MKLLKGFMDDWDQRQAINHVVRVYRAKDGDREELAADSVRI
jgi:hypothetical protein